MIWRVYRWLAGVRRYSDSYTTFDMRGITMLDPDTLAFYEMMRRLPKHTGQVEWLEDKLMPRLHSYGHYVATHFEVWGDWRWVD